MLLVGKDNYGASTGQTSTTGTGFTSIHTLWLPRPTASTSCTPGLPSTPREQTTITELYSRLLPLLTLGVSHYLSGHCDFASVWFRGSHQERSAQAHWSYGRFSDAHLLRSYNQRNNSKLVSNSTSITLWSLICDIYLVKGSPYITFECFGAQIGFGSLIDAPPPPVISINNNPPNSQIQSNEFLMEVAQGPLHAEGTWWHVYTGKSATRIRGGSNFRN